MNTLNIKYMLEPVHPGQLTFTIQYHYDNDKSIYPSIEEKTYNLHKYTLYKSLLDIFKDTSKNVIYKSDYYTLTSIEDKYYGISHYDTIQYHIYNIINKFIEFEKTYIRGVGCSSCSLDHKALAICSNE